MPYSARPPGLMSRFRMITSCPPWAIFCAANIPAGPAPTTKTVFTSSPSSLFDLKRQRRHHPECAWLRMTFLLSLTVHAHARPGLIDFPSGGHVLPGLFQQFFGLFRVRLAQHGIARLIVKVVFQRH